MNIDGNGIRLNDGKLRLDLCPTYAQEQYARVLGKGANKYPANNWRRGMKWSNVISSLERHLLALKSGEDYDKETGEYHSAHIMCNAAFLTEYYRIYPQGDDRHHSYLNNLKIGLDIDGVLADFISHYNKYYNVDKSPEIWNHDPEMDARIKSLTENKDFWMTIPVLTKACDLSFEPTCYITSRDIPVEWTREWLYINGFPNTPVYSIGYDKSKVSVIKNLNIDIFVDDRFDNFVEINKSGTLCYLFDTPQNKRYNVQSKRIYDLKFT